MSAALKTFDVYELRHDPTTRERHLIGRTRHRTPLRLGEVQAASAADAISIARTRWPHVPLVRLKVEERRPGGAAS